MMVRHQIQHYTQQLAKDSSLQLRDLNNYSQEDAMDPRQWKLQRERLQHDFTKALDNFQRAQRSAAQKEKDAIKKYKNQGVRIGRLCLECLELNVMFLVSCLLQERVT